MRSAVHGVEFAGSVLGASDTTAVVSTCPDPPCDVGNVVNIEVAGGYRAMAILSGLEAGQSSLMTLTGVAWLGPQPRASRVPRAYRVNVDFLCSSELKRTIGQTMDLSTSGVRVRLRAPLQRGDAARLLIRVGETESVEVLGRVSRIIQCAVEGDRGYDIAFGFDRWIRGEETLHRILGSGDPIWTSDSTDSQTDWFSHPEAA